MSKIDKKDLLGLIFIPYDNKVSDALDFLRPEFHEKNMWFMYFAWWLQRPEMLIKTVKSYQRLDYDLKLYVGIIKKLRLFYPDIKDKIDMQYTRVFLDSYKERLTKLLNNYNLPYQIQVLDDFMKQKELKEEK